MVDIPHDIWCQIALYIPSKNLSSLISLNRSLFNIVLDGRYQEVMWAKMDELMIRTLIRLRCRAAFISPVCSYPDIDNESPESPQSPPVSDVFMFGPGSSSFFSRKIFSSTRVALLDSVLRSGSTNCWLGLPKFRHHSQTVLRPTVRRERWAISRLGKS